MEWMDRPSPNLKHKQSRGCCCFPHAC